MWNRATYERHCLVRASPPPAFVRDVNPPGLAAPPTEGENIEDIANDFRDLIMPGVTHWQHPSFFAYFPAAGTLESIIGDLYAATAMNPGFNVRMPLVFGCYPRLCPRNVVDVQSRVYRAGERDHGLDG